MANDKERERREKREKDLPFALALKSAKPSLCLSFAIGECGDLPFAEANGKWQMHLPFALAQWQSRCICLWQMQSRLFSFVNEKAKAFLIIGQRERREKGII